MSGLDLVLHDFKADIERAEHLLALVKDFREFGASIPPNRPMESSEPWPSAVALHSSSKLRRTDLPVLSGSLQLYLAGRFEYCIRQIVEVVADEIAARATKYADLPNTIKIELRSRTLEIAQNPRRYGYDDGQTDSLLESLVACKGTTRPPLAIASTVLSLTDSNMKDRILTDMLKRVGIEEFWKSVGKQATMKLELERTSDSDTTVEAQGRLNAIMDERNQVAHPTSSTRFPDPDQVLRAARFLKVLASTTVDLAKVHLAAYKPAEV